MTTVNIRFANDVQVTVNAKVKFNQKNDIIDIVLDKLDSSDGKITLSYSYNYSKACTRRVKISDDILRQIVTMLQQGLSNREIADKLDLSIESIYQVRIAKSTRYRKLYEEVGGWPRTYRSKSGGNV